MSKQPEQSVYERQGFGQTLDLPPPAALLIVDFINGFADPEVFGGGNIQAAIDNTTHLLALTRERGWPVCFTRVIYAEDGSDANIFTEKVPACLRFTATSTLSQVVPALTPADGELVIHKRYPSAFFGTHLASCLTLRGIKTLFIVGATTSGCVRASALDALCHGFRPALVTDCVGDRSVEQHEANLFDLGMKYTELVTLDDVRAWDDMSARSQ